jgi:hypothetical protein
MINGRQAFDKATGLTLSTEDAQAAADNPGIYTWVEWR